MSKQAIIAILLGILIILGVAAAFFYSQNKNSTPSVTKSNSSSSSDPTSNTLTSTFIEKVTNEQNSKCTFNVDGEKGTASGTIYTSGENTRVDFTTTTDGKKSATYMVRNGDIYFIWQDSIKTGVKMEMKINDLAKRLGGNKQFESFNTNEKVDFKCAEWTPDTKLFKSPNEIKFISIDAVIPSGVNMKITGSPADSSDEVTTSPNQCSICESLTGEAKTSCMTQFKCN